MNEDIHIGYAGDTASAGDWVTLTNTAGTIDYGSDTNTYTIDPNYWGIPIVGGRTREGIITKIEKGDDDMRCLYEVILVNPKTDEFFTTKVVAKSETSALMKAYTESGIIQPTTSVPFDELETRYNKIMEWKKEKSLEKALETIKKAVE